jgi:hypothetical protein
MVKVAVDWRLILLSANVAALCRACSDSSRNRIFHVYKNTPCFEFPFRSRYLLTCNRPNHSMKPTAPLQDNFSVFATDPAPGLISFSLDDQGSTGNLQAHAPLGISREA